MDTLKYSGMYFGTGKTGKVNTSRSVWNIYASTNNILSYTCIFVSVSQLRKYTVCWNSVFRRLFGMHMWESVKEIQYYCGRLDIRHVADKHMVHFFGNIHKTNNVVVQRCFSNFKTGDKSKRLCNEYGFTIICYLVVCVISFDNSSNSLYFSPSMSSSP